MRKKLMITGAALCAALYFFSGFMLLREYHDRQQSAKAFKSVAGLVQEDSKLPVPNSETEEALAPKLTAFEKYAEVFAQNDDLIGWISIPGTRIEYPVMQTKDHPDYGVPYAAESCAADISDNMVLYVHHREHKIIRFDTLDGFGEYEVIAVFKTAAYSEQNGKMVVVAKKDCFVAAGGGRR